MHFNNNLKCISFETYINDRYLKHFLGICLQVNASGPQWWYISIGSGNGLIPSGNKPFTEPMFAQIYIAKWRYLATMG